MTTNEPIIIEGEDAMEHFKLAQCISRLRLEVATGMHFRQPTLAAVKRYYGYTGGRKKGALAFLEQLYLDRYGWEYGSHGDGSSGS